VAKAGFFPGIVLYLTYWFRQRQLADAIALFCAANPVANVLGSPLSVLIWITPIGLDSPVGGGY